VKTFARRKDFVARCKQKVAVSMTAPQPYAAMSSILRFAEWQALAAKSPVSAAREVARRMRETLSPQQNRAVFASTMSEADLITAFERVANTIAPLGGIPYVLKDIFYSSGTPLLAGSKFPPGILPVHSRDSKIPHMLRGFGAVMAGRTHLHEFAYGLTGENPHYGDCDHPFFPGHTSGGSSSGSAAAVAAGIVPLGIGTDTGGSIRVPAAFCGLFGFRVTPRSPLIEDAFPLAPSFDTAGWFTRFPEDLLIAHRYFVGKPLASEREPRGCFLNFDALGQAAEGDVALNADRLGRVFAPAADAETQTQLQRAFTDTANAYAVLQSVEAYAVHTNWLDRHRALYDPGVWARLDKGRQRTPEEIDAAQARALALRSVWQSFFLTYDYLVMPATPFPALTKAQCTQENRERLLALTAPASLAGLPVLSVPVALASGMSSGLQIIVNNPLSPVIPWILKRSATC
jgi:aspartyl-tRNA(Asn)/glutamyl-tRNA(Gln) amidotransferase subunit A